MDNPFNFEQTLNSQKLQNSITQSQSIEYENNDLPTEDPDIDKFVICVDPQTQRIYTQAINNDIIIVEKNVPDYIQKQAKQAIEDLNNSLNIQNQNLLFSKEAQAFRRRKIPSYLLHKNQSDYPIYLSQSSLSLAFANVNCIKLKINLHLYQDVLSKNNMNLYDEQQQNLLENGEIENNEDRTPGQHFGIEIEAGLVTGADEVIKNILRDIYRKFQVCLEPLKKDTHRFILQVSGFKEYIWGNYSMLQFERVRLNLRGHEHLDLVLTEKEKNDDKEKVFPPIEQRSLSEIQKGNISEIEWEKYKNVPMIIWYPQVNLPDEHLLKENAQRIIQCNTFSTNQNGVPQNIRNFFTLNNNLQKELCQELKDMDQNKGKKNSDKKSEVNKLSELYREVNKTLKQRKDMLPDNSILFSGDCDQPFKIKINGIENIQKIFTSTLSDLPPEDQAVYNGQMPPSYLTLEREKKNQEDFHQSNKAKVSPEKQENSLKFVRVPVANTGAQYVNSGEIIQDLQSNKNLNFMEHGDKGTGNFSNLSKSIGLDCYPYTIYVEVALFHGSKMLNMNSKATTKKIQFTFKPRFQQWIGFPGLNLSQITKEVRACFNIYIQTDKIKQIIASTSMMIFDENGKLNQGNIALNLWPFYKTDERLTCMQQFWFTDTATKKHIQQVINNQKEDINKELAKAFAQIHIQLDQFEQPVYYSIRDEKSMEALGFPKLKKNNFIDADIVQKNWNITPKTEYLAKLQSLLNSDSLARENYTEKEKFILMICRNHYKTLTNALQIFLYAIDWSDPTQVQEAHSMLQVWTPVTPEDALPLINAEYADEQVRLYAIERISTFCDEELGLYMLELIQTLFFEAHHFSPLGEMMLERALMNPNVVGHEFFWQMKSQVHQKASCERFILLIEQFLMLSGSYRSQIALEVILNEKLNKIGNEIKSKGNQDQMRLDAQEKLKLLMEQELKDKESFNFALDSRMQCKSFDIKPCKVLNSKKLPLWLVMNNLYKGQQIKVMFKCGDDIRQDQLTIQLIKIMDKIWLNSGFDFRMKPYQVLATADQVGMIEVVNDSETTSDIHKDFGGVLGALKDQTIWKFLKDYNKDPHMFEIATENFLKSCAGYCVATYILGIGDRHSGNIMLTQTGHLFHIDFGHFLGNFKKKMGINRERAPFVFTQEMAFVMGGRDGKLFKKFELYCTDAFNLVRKHGSFLINIFQLMISAGMPELQSSKDILYLKNQLSLELNDQQATSKFKSAIIDSLNSRFRRFDNLIHNIRRK